MILRSFIFLGFLDKQYLGIDILLGFAMFNVREVPRLSRLFSEAGCGNLLDLEEMTRFTKIEIKEKDTEVLLSYLRSTPSAELAVNQQQQNVREAISAR